MAPAPSKLAVELDLICRFYRRPILSGRGGEGVLPPPMNVEAIRGGDFDVDDDEVASVASGNDNSEALLSHHSAVNTHPTQPEVDSQRPAPSDASTASSNSSWNDNDSISTLSSEPLVVLPPYDHGSEDLYDEAEVDTVASTLLLDDEGSLMEMESIGTFSVEYIWIPLDPMEIVQLWHSFAATSPVGMDVSF